MASVDAGQYSLSSDEKVESECSPCKDDGLVREAKYFCPECSEYFCSSCESSLHGRLKATKSHKLQLASGGAKTSHRKTLKTPLMICNCNLDRLVEFVCNEHKCLVCSECKVVNHRKCNAITIAEKSKSVNESTISSSLQNTKDLEEKAVLLYAEKSNQHENFEANRSVCKEEIYRTRDQLMHFIEIISKTAADELESIPFEQSKEVENGRSVCSSAIEKLKADRKVLQDALASGDNKQMFAADFLVTNSFGNYSNLLEEVEREMISTSLTFKPDGALIAIQNQFKTLGDIIKDTKHMGRRSNPNSLVSLKAVKGKQFDITPSGAMRMTGALFMPDGNLLICDFGAKKLIILDHEFNVKSGLALSDRPWDAAILSESEIIVTLTVSKKLQKIVFMPALKIGSSINMQKECFDVETVGTNILVCTKDPGDGEILVLDFDGNVHKRLGLHDDGKYFLNHPFHMTVSCAGDRIYVSDISGDIVFCLSVDGQILSKFSYSDLTSPRGILLDKENHFLVCCADGVYFLKADGTSCSKFLTNADGIVAPYCLNYRDNGKKLVVTCESKLWLFKLEQKKLETNKN